MQILVSNSRKLNCKVINGVQFSVQVEYKCKVYPVMQIRLQYLFNTFYSNFADKAGKLIVALGHFVL